MRKPRIRLCPIHHKALPCMACRGAKGGKRSTPKKRKANRLKAKRAADIRWGRITP